MAYVDLESFKVLSEYFLGFGLILLPEHYQISVFVLQSKYSALRFLVVIENRIFDRAKRFLQLNYPAGGIVFHILSI